MKVGTFSKAARNAMGDRAVPLHHTALNECEANDSRIYSYSSVLSNDHAQSLHYHELRRLRNLGVERIKDLMPMYNRRHIEIIYGPYLDYFIPIFYDRYIGIHDGIKKMNIQNLCFAVPKQKMTINTFGEFVKFVESQSGNDALLLRISEQFFPDIHIDVVHVNEDLPRKVHTVQRRFVQFIIKCYNLIFQRNARFLISSLHMSIYNTIRLLIALRFQVIICENPDIEKKLFLLNLDRDLEVECNHSNKFDQGFLNLLLEFMPAVSKITPEQFTEAFSTDRFGDKVKCIFTANSHEGNEFFKHLTLQLILKNKSKLIIAQHGGHYGIGRYNWSEEHELAITDTYLTWGWLPNLDSIDVQALGYQKRMIKRYPWDTVKYDIMIIGLTLPTWSTRFYSTPMADGFLELMASVNQIMQSALDNELSVAYRKSGSDRGWDQEALISDKRVVVTHNTSYRCDMRSGNLILCINNGTNFLEALLSDIPAINFIPRKLWGIRSDFNGMFEKLKAEKLIFEDETALIEFIRSVNIDEWWKSASVRFARKEFLFQYARNNPELISNLSDILIKACEHET